MKSLHTRQPPWLVAVVARIDLFSLPLLAGLFLLLQFAPGLVAPGAAMSGWALYLPAISLAWLCFAAFSRLGVLGGRAIIGRSRSVPLTWDPCLAVATGVASLIGGFLLKLRHCDLDSTSGIVCALEGATAWAPNLLHRIGICVVLLGILGSPVPGRGRTVNFSLAAYLLWSVVAGAGRFEVIASLGSLCAVLWYRGGRAWRWPLLLLMLVAIPAFLGKSWIKYSEHLAADDWGSLGFLTFVYNAVFARISQHQIVGAILDQWAQGPLGLYGWQDFVHALLNQPLDFLNGNDLGKAFSVLGQYEFSTGVGPTFVGDFYLMGGLPGIALGMACVGLAYGTLSALVTGRPSQSVVLVYGILLPILVHGLEDWFFLTMARAIQAALLCLVVIAVIDRLARAMRTSEPVFPDGGPA